MASDDNLEQQYDQIIAYIDGCRIYSERIVSRFSRLLFRNPVEYYRVTGDPMKVFAKENPLSGNYLSEFRRKLLSKYATEAEKKNEYYPIETSEYNTHALSTSLLLKFPGVDFEKIKKLHELKKMKIASVSGKQIAAVALASVTFLLNSIPQSIVERVMDYEDFALLVFGSAIAFTIYLLVLLSALGNYNLANKIHKFAGEVVEYTAIRIA